MRDAERKRLVKLIKEAHKKSAEAIHEHIMDTVKTKGRFNSKTDGDRQSMYEIEADYLLENGVIVPPCTVGDKVWEIEYSVGSYELWETRPLETEVKAVCILTENDYYKIDSIGKDVFLTREEAEQALRKEDESNGAHIR